MADFFEIDFLDVETKKSGDAIALRYELNGQTYVHVVDGGYLDTGNRLLEHIKKFYDDPQHIHHVVATHPDGDHTAGLRAVVENHSVGTLWMNRPWLYADELLQRFARYTNRDNLVRDLKKAFPNTAALEEIALKKNIPIRETFQGIQIGAFTVMAPTRDHYINKVVESEKTGVVAKVAGVEPQTGFMEAFASAFRSVVNFVKGAWGDETFPAEGTSAENEMSVVQYANLCGMRILLTGDTGREGLQEVVTYAPFVGLTLPGIDRFQVPHHGSRRNVSTDLLDKILGPRLDAIPTDENTKFTAIISSAKADEDHPRKAVVRAMHHRGAKVVSTEGQNIRTQKNAPDRAGWVGVPTMPYPEDQEA
jgi:beta-lactamase superfamily II metal-dependent hydrolase